jgi:hypothetical protein
MSLASLNVPGSWERSAPYSLILTLASAAFEQIICPMSLRFLNAALEIAKINLRSQETGYVHR